MDIFCAHVNLSRPVSTFSQGAWDSQAQAGSLAGPRPSGRNPVHGGLPGDGPNAVCDCSSQKRGETLPVLPREDEEAFEPTPEGEEEMLESIAQIERGEFISGSSFWNARAASVDRSTRYQGLSASLCSNCRSDSKTAAAPMSPRPIVPRVLRRTGLREETDPDRPCRARPGPKSPCRS